MPQELPEQLHTLNPTLLTEIVRQQQENPTFGLLDWSVAPLSDQGIINPEGLFLFQGEGHDGQCEKPWSVVLKILRESDTHQSSDNLWYWKREALLAQSDLMRAISCPIASPRVYRVMEKEHSVWLWMEHIQDAIGAAWRLEQYAFAADQIGRFNAAYATGAPLPDAPWLCRDHARGWTEGLSPQTAWANPYVQRHFSSSLQTHIMQLWGERERLYTSLDRAPQIFSHFDCQRRNLIIRNRAGGCQELVAVDWGLCGLGALGGDLMALIGSSVALCEWGSAHLAELEDVVFDAYLIGLRAGGWRGNADWVRLAYSAWLGLHWGLAMPAAAAFWCTDVMAPRAIQQFGRPLDDLATGWATLCEFSLARADEARQLMASL